MAKMKAAERIFFILGISFLLEMLILSPAFCIPDTVTDDLNNQSNEETALRLENKNNKTHIVANCTQSVFKANETKIWKILTDFKNYPSIFKRIESVAITKNEGELVYTESRLKPGMFVQKIVQHTVNDLSAGPKLLNWQMIDGNFKYLKGKWEIKPRTADTCVVKYTLSVDVGPFVPPALTNFIVKHTQQEIINDLKHYVEDYANDDLDGDLSSAAIKKTATNHKG